MIELPEQYGYSNPKSVELTDCDLLALRNKSYTKTIQRSTNPAYCFKIICNGTDQNTYLFETSYFVGVDWIVENELPIYVKPKLNESEKELNFVKMLFDVLKEPENYNHIEELCEISFEKPHININQKQDLLSPLLLIQFINILKSIAKKGLKKSYYSVTNNLNARIRGKVLINKTIRNNHFNNKTLFTYCQYTEFGINSIENRILKKAFEFAVAAIQNIKGFDPSAIMGMINYIRPAFQHVDSNIDIEELKYVRINKLYKEYGQALRFAKLILRRFGYNISKVNSVTVSTPPFWIDMSKLFELYVYSKLKERFPRHQEVTYHKVFNFLEPDYIINSIDGKYKMVVDAKYKPQYQDGKIKTEDIRQISGYARLEKVYKFLGIEERTVIDCLVIYSNQFSNRKDFKGDNFNYELEKEYHRFFKIGIELPEVINVPN